MIDKNTINVGAAILAACGYGPEEIARRQAYALRRLALSTPHHPDAEGREEAAKEPVKKRRKDNHSRLKACFRQKQLSKNEIRRSRDPRLDGLSREEYAREYNRIRRRKTPNENK